MQHPSHSTATNTQPAMPYPHHLDEDPDPELAAEDRETRRRLARLAAHPDPRDPDYPGDIEEDEETTE